jgi:uncharacterized protein YndB with AHSA1/START domain
MLDIVHRIGAVASPEDVYRALTTVEGLAGWWTEDTKQDGDAGEAGGVIRFRFAGAPEPGGFDMQVLEVAPCELVRATFLMSLKSLTETGSGQPAPRDVQVSNWH